MLKPRALRHGDTISVVSPASPITEEKLHAGLQVLAEWGYRLKIGQHALSVEHYLAGSDQERAADLTAAFLDPESQAVYCSRGGYGSARLLPLLDLPKMAATQKMFLGFSDVTTLHLALNQLGLPTFHAPMALSFTRDREPWVQESFFDVLGGGSGQPITAPRGELLTPGSAEGIVTGGCLCLLCDSLATDYAFDPLGKIVLIEDVDESPHRVDAMLTHLLNARVLQSAAGIIVGEMTRTDEKEDATIGRRPWREIVQDRIGGLGIPAIVGYPFGHMDNMLSLPLGIRARLDADAGTLTYLESACA